MVQNYYQLLISYYGDIAVYFVPTDMFSEHLLSVIDTLKYPPILFGDDGNDNGFVTEEEKSIHGHQISENDPRVIHQYCDYEKANHVIEYPKGNILKTFLWLNPWERGD